MTTRVLATENILDRAGTEFLKVGAIIMKVCLAVALVIVVSLPSTLLADQEYGGVVRIHFDESTAPDLSVIRDMYTGSASTVCAHIVIDSLPEGVTGYHLAYEIVSGDSSVVVLPGFHPSPGWKILDSQAGFPTTRERRVAQTPASVGYWVLWLKEGRQSRGYVRLNGLWARDWSGIVLLSGIEDRRSAVRAYHGGIHMPAPRESNFERGVLLTERNWEETPEIRPVWVLQVQGDLGHLLHNEFAVDPSGSPLRRRFPVSFVQIGQTTSRTDERGDFGGGEHTAYVGVRSDGTLATEKIEWVPPRPTFASGGTIGQSLGGQMTLLARADTVELRNGNGELVSKIPEPIEQARCFDIPRRIAAISTQQTSSGAQAHRLSRLVLLDFDGHRVFEGDWTECKLCNIGMGRDPDILKFSLTGCLRAGDYLLRGDEQRVYSLAELPAKGRCFSPDSRFALVNAGGEISFLDTKDPESPRLMWRRTIEGVLRDIAVSDDGRLVAFRLKLLTRPQDYSFIYVLSGNDGSPVCRLLENVDEPAVGPIAFAQDYLFVGMDFSTGGHALDTQCIAIYDLQR